MTDVEVQVGGSEDVDKDMKERLEGFVPELRTLMGKYEIGIAAFPEFVPDGTIQAKAIFVSTRTKPEPQAVAEKTVEESPREEVENSGGLTE